MTKIPGLMKKTDQSPRILFKDWIDAVAKTIGVGTFILFCLAFVYEYGFFLTVGRDLQGFMSGPDYIVSAISWLPFLIGLVLICAVTIALMQIFGAAAGYAVAGPKGSSRGLIIITVPLIFLIIAEFSRLTYLHFFYGYVETFYTLLMFWLFVIGAVLCGFFVWKRVVPIKAGLIMIATAGLTTLAVSSGIQDGVAAYTRYNRVYVMRLKNENEERNISLVRNLSAGVLVRDPTAKRISFYRLEEIAHFSRRITPLDNRSPVCVFFGLGQECDPPPF